MRLYSKFMRILAFLVLAGSLWAQEPSGRGVNFYSLAKEKALGDDLASKMAATLDVVHDSKLDAYAAQLGAALAKYADSPFDFTFTWYRDTPAQSGAASPTLIIGDPAYEPITVPGGSIFLPLSLLDKAPNEAVFAFQLAHAMVHIASRHGTRQGTRTELMPVSTITVVDGDVSKHAADVLSLGALSFARMAEREADYRAVQIIAKAGYDPEPAAAYLAAKPEPPNPAFSPRPRPADRARQIRDEVRKILPPADYMASTGAFEDARATAAAIR